MTWQTSYYHYDGLGSTLCLTDENGEITDSYAYTAFGEELDTGAANPTRNPFRWLGQSGYYRDADTGDYYVRARVYRPVLARWLSEDPIESDVTSLYCYCTNEPTYCLDPLGLAEIVVTGKSDNMPLYQSANLPKTIPAMNCVALHLGPCCKDKSDRPPPTWSFNADKLTIHLYILASKATIRALSPKGDPTAYKQALGYYGHELQHMNAMVAHINDPNTQSGIKFYLDHVFTGPFAKQKDCEYERTMALQELFKMLVFGFAHNWPNRPGNPNGPEWKQYPTPPNGGPAAFLLTPPLDNSWFRPMQMGVYAYPDTLLGYPNDLQNIGQKGPIKPLQQPATNPYMPWPIEWYIIGVQGVPSAHITLSPPPPPKPTPPKPR